jgi:hypothetical protein
MTISKEMTRTGLDAAVIAPAPAARSSSLVVMTRAAVERFGPTLRYQVNRIGVAGLSGAACLLFAVVFSLSMTLPGHQSLMAIASLPLPPTVPVATTADQYQRAGNELIQSLPARDQVPSIIEGLYTSATKAGFTLDKGEYELVAGPSARIAHYRAKFPLTATYPQVRQFVDDALKTYPSLGIDALHVTRRSIAEETVSVDLQLSLFTRNSP